MSQPRSYLPILGIIALLVSDVISIGHVGNCCTAVGSGPLEVTDLGSAGLARSATRLIGCTGARCCGGKHAASNARPNAGESPGDSPSEGSESPAPGEDTHDPDTCAKCRWFAGVRSGCVPPPITVTEVAVEYLPPIHFAADRTRDLSFFSALSRRGPPAMQQRHSS